MSDKDDGDSENRKGVKRFGARVVSVSVEASERGARIVLEGPYMDGCVFEPGEYVEAVIQPDLISILPAE